MDVRYDASSWPGAKRRYVAARLRDERITFRWEGAELVVSTDDEAFVDGLLADIDEQPPRTFLSSLIDTIAQWI